MGSTLINSSRNVIHWFDAWFDVPRIDIHVYKWLPVIRLITRLRDDQP